MIYLAFVILLFFLALMVPTSHGATSASAHGSRQDPPRRLSAGPGARGPASARPARRSIADDLPLCRSGLRKSIFAKYWQ